MVILLATQDDMRAHVRRMWWLLLAQGALALLLGALMLSNAQASLRALALFLGLYWLLGGALDIAQGLALRDPAGAWRWSAAGGALGMSAGALWLLGVAAGEPRLPAGLAPLIAAAAIASGACNLTWAWRLRHHLEGEGWLMLWGALSIGLGLWIASAVALASDVVLTTFALSAVACGAGMVLRAAALAAELYARPRTEAQARVRRAAWLGGGATAAFAIAAVGLWLFGQLNLASAAPAGVSLTPAAQRGQAAFRLHCAACHNANQHMKIGPGLAGVFEPGGPLLPPGVDYGGRLPDGAAITPESFTRWLRAGGRGKIGIMPPVALTMSDAEVADVMAFLVEISAPR